MSQVTDVHDLISYAAYQYEAYEKFALLERHGFNARYAILVMNVIATCGIRLLPLSAKKNNMNSTGEILKGKRGQKSLLLDINARMQ